MKQRWLGLSNDTKGVVTGLLSAFFFASYLVINRYIYTEFKVDSLAFAFLFNALAGIYAGLALMQRYNQRKMRSVWQDRYKILLLCTYGLLAMLLLLIGQRYTTSIHASLLVTGSIVATMVFSTLFLKESITTRQKWWVVGMFVGLYVAIVGVQAISLLSGDLIILIGVIFFGLGNVLSRSLMQRHDSAIIPDLRVFLVAVIAGLVYVLFFHSINIFSLVGLWTVVSSLCFWLTMRSFAATVHLVNANHAIVLVNAQIVPASLAGVFLLNEHYSLEKFVGSVIVLVCIYFITWRGRE